MRPILGACILQSQAGQGAMMMLGNLVRAVFGVCALLLAALPAQAEWYEASTDHFVIYARDSDRDIIRFAESLERYHSAMAFLTQRKIEKPSPSNRVTIYVVGSERDIQKLMGGDNRFVAGFYIPRAGGSVAFVQEIQNQKGYPHFSTIVLLHEYAHHFLISSSRMPMPRWMNEGAAEFFAATTFNDDGSLYVGQVAQHRSSELAFAEPVPLRELFDPELYEKQKGSGYDAFYGKSWLTYHYLTFSSERAGQLSQYQRNLLEGMAPLAAAETAFGDLDALEKELRSYKNKRLNVAILGADKLSTGSPVQLRRLTEGEAEIMPLRIRSKRGVDEAQAADILTGARAVAARFPDDAAVLAALAEAEYDAGNDAEAIAAADKALALDPRQVNAYVQKGFALFRQAKDADDREAAFAAAMRPFEALNAIEPEHPLPLYYYYRSFAERGIKPPKDVRAALSYAAQLAPFDQQYQIDTGMMIIAEGENARARQFLAPLAADPHGSPAASRAKRLIAMVSDVADGTIVDVSNLPEEDEGAELSGTVN
ncbi:Peptidase_MA_2 domain-containing protein [Erythrobacter dokdonensis DSW-74]|uniref:Peptidase_MA_2 domain-containing protein n=2 Tax=Erythrobacter TaxID=1041 RepID=A0A1A7BFV9_9SPHN|nr:Peptidase_MA_2 domain-containing protein [Erythrobacter dokdonensis DSW-74]